MTAFHIPLTFIPPARNGALVPRVRALKRVAVVTVPCRSGMVGWADTWLNLGFVNIADALRATGFKVDYYDSARAKPAPSRRFQGASKLTPGAN